MPGLEGKRLDRYELLKLVGRGGMADVYQGYDPHMDRQIAVKVFKREDEEMLSRFIREARLMASFRNDHLVAVFDSGESQVGNVTWYYIVMPFMEGGTLRARIRRAPLTLEDACRSMREIASALDYIHHQGIIHRDIKSSNVLLDAEGRCYLADFGIARTESDVTQLTSAGNVLGTVDYVAPELFEPDHKADVRSDLYSLGVLLFEMVTGQLPFSAENQIAVVTMHMNKRPPAPSSISRNISPQVERVIFRALEKNPALRYGSATELAEAFCRAVAARTVGELQGRNDATTVRIPGTTIPGIATNKIVLPPVPPLTANPALLRPAPLSNATETAQYFPQHSVPPGGTQPPVMHRTPPHPPARSRSSSKRYVVAFIIALITLLLVLVPSIYFITHPLKQGNTPGTHPTQEATTGPTATPTLTPTNTPNATATAQVVAAITATAHAQATASAIAHLTATAAAQASATAGVIQTATSGTPTYQDALNDATKAATIAAKWDGIDGSDNHCTFQSDGYHVTEGVNLVNFHGCREAGNTYKNATIAVDMSMISGHSGGLLFRVNTGTFNSYTGYLFEVDSQGNYKISTVSGTSTTVLQGHDWTATAALKQGTNVKNTLQVIVQGTTFLFYANGTFLTQATDATFTSAGDIALLATTNGTKADIVYSNLKVYPLA
ncbi:MAG: serine/threonine protein kinase [Ktedonobacteraceae bacterium]